MKTKKCKNPLAERMKYGGMLPKAGGGLWDASSQYDAPNADQTSIQNSQQATPNMENVQYTVDNPWVDRLDHRITGYNPNPNNTQGQQSQTIEPPQSMGASSIQSNQYQGPPMMPKDQASGLDLQGMKKVDATPYNSLKNTSDNTPNSTGVTPNNNKFSGSPGGFIHAGSGVDYKAYTAAQRISYATSNPNLSKGMKGLGIASGVGAALSGAMDLTADIITGIGHGQHDARVEQEWRRRRMMANDPNTNPETSAPQQGTNANMAYTKYGGIPKAAFGIKADNTAPTVEGEHGEWAKTKRGQNKRFIGDKHGVDNDGDGQEGIPTSEAQEIISARLPIGANVAKIANDRFGIKVKPSSVYSDIMDAVDRKYRISDSKEILEDKDADTIKLASAKANLSRPQQSAQNLSAEQILANAHDFSFHTQETKKMLGGYDNIDPNISKDTIQQHMQGNSTNPLANTIKSKYGSLVKAGNGYNGPKGTSDFSTIDDPYFAPEDRDAFGNLFYTGDKTKSKDPKQATFDLGWNKSPYGEADAGSVMKKLTQVGFRPKKDWKSVDANEVQDFIMDYDKKHGNKILEKLYNTYGQTDQGRAAGFKSTGDFRDLDEAGRKKFFNDNIYGVRTGLASLFLHPDIAPAAPAKPADAPVDAPETASSPAFNFKSSPQGTRLPQSMGNGNYMEELTALSQLGRRQVMYDTAEIRGDEQALNNTNQQAPIFTQNRNDITSAFRTKLATNTGTPSIKNARDNADYAAALNSFNQVAQNEENANRQIYNQSQQVRNNLLQAKGRATYNANEAYEDKSNQTEANADEMRLRIAGQWENELGNSRKDNWDYNIKNSLGKNVYGLPGGQIVFDPASQSYFSFKPHTAVDEQLALDETKTKKKVTGPKGTTTTETDPSSI